MAKYRICPGCGRKGDKEESGQDNFFCVYKCMDCGQMYCDQCQEGRCVRCGSKRRMEAGKVYAK